MLAFIREEGQANVQRVPHKSKDPEAVVIHCFGVSLLEMIPFHPEMAANAVGAPQLPHVEARRIVLRPSFPIIFVDGVPFAKRIYDTRAPAFWYVVENNNRKSRNR